MSDTKLTAEQLQKYKVQWAAHPGIHSDFNNDLETFAYYQLATGKGLVKKLGNTHD